MFKGVFCPLATPFKDDAIDWPALEQLIDTQLAAGVTGLVPCGSTGESLTLSFSEQREIISLCIKKAKGRALVIPGTGAIMLNDTLALTEQARDLGADGALIVTPYYVRPSQEALVTYYTAIAERAQLPIIMYNNPGRTGVSMDVDTLITLSHVPYIKGLKEVVNDFSRLITLRAGMHPDFTLLSGDDATFAGFLAHGGHGAIASVCNIAPQLVIDFYQSWKDSDLQTFDMLWRKLSPLGLALGHETPPGPVKHILSWLHDWTLETRLPLSPLKPAMIALLRKTLDTLQKDDAPCQTKKHAAL